MAVDASPLHPEFLEENRSGRLNDTQRGNLGTYNRGIRKSELTWSLFLLALAAIIFFGARSSAPVTMRVGIPFLCVLGAIGLLAWSMIGRDPLTRDVRERSVLSIDGAIGKRRISTGADSPGTSYVHYLDVGGKTFKVGSGTYDAAPGAGYVRLYYLPRSHHVVNFERLPDPPVPDDISPKALLGTLSKSVRLHDRVQRNEARAEVQAITDKVQADFTRTPPPAPTDRDPRPLAEAILGTWRNMMMTVTFHGDGTAEASLPGGQGRSGQWTVGSDGRLHVDVMGHSDATDAWVTGDELTMSVNGMGITLHRVTDASS